MYNLNAYSIVYCNITIHSTKVLSDTLCIFAGYFKKGLFVDELYRKFDSECIIKTNIFVFVHLKYSNQYQFTRKTMASKTKLRRKPE